MRPTNRSTKGLALLWLVLLGTNATGYYSETELYPYTAYLILAGTICFSGYFSKELLSLASSTETYLILAGYAVPLLLMLLSDRSFPRGEYTSQVSLAATIVVAALLASRPDLDSTLTGAAIAIVCVGAALNLYELLIQPNTWSTAPGRSAGFFVNPNISSMALLGYGSVALLSRVRKLDTLDLFVMVVMAAGVFATFSRTGILFTPLLFIAVVLMRAAATPTFQRATGTFVIAALCFFLVSYVVSNVDLSEDAAIRLSSLEEQGAVGDYEQERGYLVAQALETIAGPDALIFGSGPLSSYDLPDTVHNMYVALILDYGLVGLCLYLFVLIRLAVLAKAASPRSLRIVWGIVGWLALWSVASHNILGDGATIALLGIALAHARREAWLPRGPVLGWRNVARLQ